MKGSMGGWAGYGLFSLSWMCLSIALTCFPVAFWVNRGRSLGREGWSKQFPFFFHSDKDLRG